jgi:hypothetical protein
VIGRPAIAAMSDWRQFCQEVPWFLQPGERAVVGDAQPWTRGAVDNLPELSALLATATLTPVSVGDQNYELLAWGSVGDRHGWLCRPPDDQDGESISEIHRSFWTLCGGIVERFREPNSWWDNQNQVLTVEPARVRLGDVLSDYAWLWDDVGLEMRIEPHDYYVVAVEANGNLTLARRSDGRLLLFAPDHAFSGVTPFAGCPPYSLLTIDGVPDLAVWIEQCAVSWRLR